MQLNSLDVASSVGGAIKTFKLMTVCFFVCHYLACGWAFIGAPTPTHDDAPTWARFYADGERYDAKQTALYKEMAHLDLPLALRERITSYYDEIWRRYLPLARRPHRR